MVDEFKQNEDVLHLARFLIAGILGTLFISSVFLILYLITAPSSTFIDDIINNLWASLSGLCFFIAVLFALYGLLYQMAKDDSNVIRVISLVYAVALLTVLLALLMYIFLSGHLTFTNPIPFSF